MENIMEYVMISIKPNWCEKIINGWKTFEIRKTKPSMIPFKCCIYCTKGIKHELNGKVIAEFICDRVIDILPHNDINGYYVEDEEYTTSDVAEKSCVDFQTLDSYLKGKKGYAWHISNLKVYDKPKELKNYYMERPPQSWCYAPILEIPLELLLH